MKRTYNIPTVEIIVMEGEYPLMALAGSKDWSPAPPRRDPAF